MQCPECQAQIPAGKAFCVECGCDLSSAAQAPAVQAAPALAPTDQDHPVTVNPTPTQVQASPQAGILTAVVEVDEDAVRMLPLTAPGDQFTIIRGTPSPGDSPDRFVFPDDTVPRTGIVVTLVGTEKITDGKGSTREVAVVELENPGGSAGFMMYCYVPPNTKVKAYAGSFIGINDTTTVKIQ